MSEVLSQNKYLEMVEELHGGDDLVDVRKQILCSCLSDEQSNQAMQDIMVQLLAAQETYDGIVNDIEQRYKAEGFLNPSSWRNYTTLKNVADEEYKKNTTCLMDKLKELTMNFEDASVQWGDVGVVKEGVNPVLKHMNNISDSLKCKLNSLENVAGVLVKLHEEYGANKDLAREIIREVDASEVLFTKLKEECKNENEAKGVIDAMEKMKALCFEKKQEFVSVSKELLGILSLSDEEIIEVEKIICEVLRYQAFLFCGNDLEAYNNRYHAEIFHFQNMHFYRVVFGINGECKSANKMEQDGDADHRFMLSNCVLHRRFTEGPRFTDLPEVTDEEKTGYMLYLAVVCRMYSMDNKRRSKLLSHTIDKVNKSLLIVVDIKADAHDVPNLLAPHSVENVVTDMKAFTLKVPCMSNGELYTTEVPMLKFHPSSLNLAPIVVEDLSRACRVWIVGQLRMTKVNGDRWYYLFADVVTCMLKDFTLLLEHKLKKYDEVKGYESYEIVKIQAMICYLIKVLSQFNNKELQWSDFEDNTSEFGLLWHISSCEESSIPFQQLKIKLDKAGVRRGIKNRARKCGKIWEKKEYLTCCEAVISLLNEAGIMECDTPLLNIKLIHSYLVKLKIIEERDVVGEFNAAEQAMEDLEKLEEAEQAKTAKKKRKKKKKKKKKKNKMAKAVVQSIIEQLVTSVIEIAEQKPILRHSIYVEAARIGKLKTAEKAKAIAEKEWKQEVKAQKIKSFRYFHLRRYPLQICLEEWKRHVKEAKVKKIVKVLPPRFSPTSIKSCGMDNIHPKKRSSHLQAMCELVELRQLNKKLSTNCNDAYDDIGDLDQEVEDLQRTIRVKETLHGRQLKKVKEDHERQLKKVKEDKVSQLKVIVKLCDKIKAMEEEMKAMTEKEKKDDETELDFLRQQNYLLEDGCVHLSSVIDTLQETLDTERKYNEYKLKILNRVFSNVGAMCKWGMVESE